MQNQIIPAISHDKGDKIDPIAINKMLTRYYKDLYSATKLRSFLSKIRLQQVSEKEFEKRNAPIGKQAITRMITKASKWKVLGPDGKWS